MRLAEFKRLLVEHPDKNIRFVLPTGGKCPPHAHVTEVARIDKRFVDCGGTRRTDSICRLQTWFADDTDHRLTAAKLVKILTLAAPLLETEDIELDIECEAPFISQFPIQSTEIAGGNLFIHLGIKHTACLAEDKCLPPALARQPLSFKGIPSLQPSKCCS